jgi:hypothetical protein
MALAGGSHLSAGEGRKMGTGSGLTRWATGSFSVLARKGCLGPFPFLFCFLLFLFCFLIYLITFANLVQIASNQLCKVSKIQNSNPEQ